MASCPLYFLCEADRLDYPPVRTGGDDCPPRSRVPMLSRMVPSARPQSESLHPLRSVSGSLFNTFLGAVRTATRPTLSIDDDSRASAQDGGAMEYPRIVVETSEQTFAQIDPALTRRIDVVARTLNLRFENAVTVALRKWVTDVECTGLT